MNEDHKLEIEELLNELVEGTATERQETEFKRLSQHEPAILDQLGAMRRHKALLNSLPAEHAPESLSEDIRSALERNQILNNIAKDDPSISGSSHLLLRRILTTAAMFLLPIGLLSFVVFEIVKPPSVGPSVYVSTGKTLFQENQDTLAGTPLQEDLPFNGTLVLSTDQQVAISNYVEKMVFDNGLINFTIPNRNAEIATYQINGPQKEVSDLVQS
jgi:hypothetical protein